VRGLANWQANAAAKKVRNSFVVARVRTPDFTGVPWLVDLAAMRSAVARLTKNTGVIEPLVPVDLASISSVQVDFSSTRDAGLRRHRDGIKGAQLALSVSQVGHAGCLTGFGVIRQESASVIR